jgi:thiol:disulfide interchange protein DsbD
MGKRLPFRIRTLLWALPTAASAIALLCGMIDPPASGDDADPSTKAQSQAKAKASLICEYKTLVPGATTTIAVAWELKPKWHMYWPGRNDTGEAPSIEFELPKGFTTDALQWPAPVRHVEGGDILSHVYFDRLTVLATLHVPATVEPGSTVTLKAKLAWMICEATCVPEQATVKLKIPIALSREQPARSPQAGLIEAARRRIPRDLEKHSKDVSISWVGKTVRIEAIAATHLSFYPDETCVALSNPIADADTDRSLMVLRLDDSEKGQSALSGVLEIHRGKEDRQWVHIHSDPSAASTNPNPGRPTSLPPRPPTALPPSLPGVPVPSTPQPKPIP